MRSLVLSLFSINKNKKVVKTKIYLPQVVYKAQTKAIQALGKSRKFVNTTMYMYRVVYTVQTKTRQALGKSRKFVNTTIYIYRVDYNWQRRHQQKTKNLHSKRSIIFYYRGWSTKVNYIKHRHQEKKYQY